MEKKKVILFGGTFDPVHHGHTTVANYACNYIGAEKTIFIPAKRSVLKDFAPKANDLQRYEMLSLVIADNDKFELSDYEIKKTKPSFTLDTVKYFKNKLNRQYDLYWLIGADAIKDFPLWYKVEELIDTCNLCLICRAGFEKPDFSSFKKQWGMQRVEKMQKNIIETPLIDINSTEIRKLLAKNKDVDNMLNPSVAKYIKKHNLYRQN
jgi:nicotinate-nucleotide adenylyltransferase